MSFPRYERYKDSGVGWLGEVPEHWSIRRMKTLFEIKKRIAGETGYDILSITQNGIKIKDTESNEGQVAMDYAKYQFVYPGDFAMNHMDLLTGYIDISKVEGVTSPDYRVFSVRNPTLSHPGFFLRLFQSAYHQKIFYAFGQGASQFGRWRLPTEAFNDFALPYPPLSEQVLIGNFLDRETAKIDSLIEEQRRLIELLKEKRQAVISHAVTKGLNPEIPMTASEVDWLSETPAHWSGIPLGFLIRFVSGGTPNKANEAYWDGDVPWVSPKDMKVFEISDAEDHVTELALNETGLRLVQPDHVLVVVRGMILLHSFPAARNLVPVTINQDMKALKCCNKLLPSFLLYLFRGIAKLLVSFAGESAHGTKKMQTSVLSGLQIPLPPTEEQQAITVWLNDKVAGYDSLLANSADAIQLLGQRRATLISAAVTGRIDVRNYTPKEAA